MLGLGFQSSVRERKRESTWCGAKKRCGFWGNVLPTEVRRFAARNDDDDGKKPGCWRQFGSLELVFHGNWDFTRLLTWCVRIPSTCYGTAPAHHLGAHMVIIRTLDQPTDWAHDRSVIHAMSAPNHVLQSCNLVVGHIPTKGKQ